MSRIDVGAFEAKTHFSQLLKEVEQGNIVHVTRRGKPIAVIRPEEIDREMAIANALERISARRQEIHDREHLTTKQILNFRDHGRK